MQLLRQHPDVQKDLARRLLRVLRLSGTYDPKPDLKEQVAETLSSKIQASQRSRPTTLQILFSPTPQLLWC